MNKLLLLFGSAIGFTDAAFAGSFEFSGSGMAGEYFGIMETRRGNNLDNMPNRAVFRADGKFKGAYRAVSGSRVGIHADYTVVDRQHDKNYPDGDWRFFPYLLGEDDRFGKLTAGYTYNAALLLHTGAHDITWLGIRDSNLTYFLSSANWKNGRKQVKFATPKSTAIMDDGRAFKISYFTPEIGNTTFGFSYTPDNASRRGMVSRYVDYEKPEDGYTAGARSRWKLGAGKLYTSVAYGIFNRTDNEWTAGARWEYAGFDIGFSYKKAWVDGNKNPVATAAAGFGLPAYFDNYREGQAWDISLGYDFGRFKTNIAYLHTEAENTRHRDDLWVQSNRFAYNEYIELYWINGYLNSKGPERQSSENNRGYAFITGVALKY